MKYISLIFATFFLWSCNSKEQSTFKYTGGKLDLMQRVPSDTKVLDFVNSIMINYDSLVVDVQYIPLDNKEGIIGQLENILYHNGLYIVYDKQQDCVYFHDNNGTCVNIIDEQGGGPTEYGAIANIDIDPIKSELIIADRFRPQILYYDLNGHFKSKRSCPIQNSQTFWLKDSVFIHQLDPFQNHGISELEHFNLLAQVGDSIKYKSLLYYPSQTGHRGSCGLFKGYNNTLYYKPLFSDSIYTIHSENTYSLAYYAKFDDSVWKKHYLTKEFVHMDEQKGERLFRWLYDNKAYLAGYTDVARDHNGKMNLMLYDKNQDKIFISKFKKYNDCKQLDYIWGYDIIGVKDDSFISMLSSDFLTRNVIEPMKSGKLIINDKKLIEILKKIDEDSNPLLILTKFKTPKIPE